MFFDLHRQLGFPLGAKEALVNTYFEPSGRLPPILLDELNCQGNESSILECTFDPWGQHDCGGNEIAGVVCKQQQDKCLEDEVTQT